MLTLLVANRRAIEGRLSVQQDVIHSKRPAGTSSCQCHQSAPVWTRLIIGQRERSSTPWDVLLCLVQKPLSSGEKENAISDSASSGICHVQVTHRRVAMRPIQGMLRGAGRLYPGTLARPLPSRKAAPYPGRSLRRLRTAAVLQSRVQPVASPAASGRAVVGGGVTDPTVEVAPPTSDEVQLCHLTTAHPFGHAQSLPVPRSPVSDPGFSQACKHQLV